MPQLHFPDQFQENTRHASAFRIVCKNALGPIGPAKSALDSEQYSSVLRGAYCLIVASVDAYLTNYFLDALTELSLTNANSNDSSPFITKVNSFLKNSCRVSNKNVKSIKIGTPDFQKDELLSALSGVTFNKGFQFASIYGLLFEEITEKEFWSKCVPSFSNRRDSWPMETWWLVVDRRNAIMHSGDLDVRGIELREFEEEFVENALLIAVEVVSIFERQAKRVFHNG